MRAYREVLADRAYGHPTPWDFSGIGNPNSLWTRRGKVGRAFGLDKLPKTFLATASSPTVRRHVFRRAPGATDPPPVSARTGASA